MLRRIQIRGFKSFDKLDLTLQRLSVLFGPNAAGKSNLLDALQLLSRLATVRTLKDAFESPYRGNPLESFSFGPNGIRDLLGQNVATFSIEVDVELSPAVIRKVNRQVWEMKKGEAGKKSTKEDQKPKEYVTERHLRYGVALNIRPKSGILQVRNEYLTALSSQWRKKKSRRPFLEKSEDRLHLRMEGQAHPRYHDVGLDHTILSLPLYPPHYPHMVAMREELASWSFFYFEPRERMRAKGPVREVRHIGMMGEDLAAYLNTLRAVNERQYKAIGRALHQIIPSITGIDVDVSDLGEVELKLLEGNTPIPARVVSEGSLRTLGFLALASAQDPPALIGFEEPENGIHPRRIRLISELLRTTADDPSTQVIATTHSPTLLDQMPAESLYVCRKKNQRTVIEPFSPTWELGRKGEIRNALDAEERDVDTGEEPKLSTRILRGDFDD